MLLEKDSYFCSLTLAVLLHVVLLALLIIKLAPSPKVVSVNQSVNIVQAALIVEIPPNNLIKPKLEQAKQVESKKNIAEQRKIQKQFLRQQIAVEKQQLTKQLKTQAAQATQTEIDKYKAMIIQTISSYWIVPENLAQGVYCQLLVHVAPGGVVLSVDLIKSSGNYLLDSSAKTAILKASPLPVPTDSSVFDNFREIKLTVRPEGIQ
jgi:colicin import membrane protein